MAKQNNELLHAFIVYSIFPLFGSSLIGFYCFLSAHFDVYFFVRLYQQIQRSLDYMKVVQISSLLSLSWKKYLSENYLNFYLFIYIHILSFCIETSIFQLGFFQSLKFNIKSTKGHGDIIFQHMKVQLSKNAAHIFLFYFLLSKLSNSFLIDNYS